MLTDAMSNGEDVLAQDVLSFFTKLARTEPRFLRTQLADVVNTMFEIAEAKSLNEPTRHMAITFVLKLLEGKEKALGMLQKLPRFINTFLEILLNLLLDIKDEPHWHTVETNNENAGVTKGYYFGCSGLEQFSKALGGKTIAPVAIEQLSAYLVAPEWEKRHTALIALFYIAEGSSKVMINYLEQLVNMVLHSFQDPHPRVRWAAIRSIAWWSIEFFPDLQEQYHNQVLPALASAMDDFQNPRVQAHASVAVMKFCISKKPETLVPYLDGILNKLLVLLQTDNQMVQEAALDALSYIADFSKEHFQKYYDFIMPHLKALLVNANDKSNHIIRFKAMECISFVGIAVGKEKFRDDLHQSLQESRVKELDTIVYILQAWSRICQCVGKDFLPYMSRVMPFLVECAQLEPDKTVLTNGPYSSTQKVKLWDEIICIKGSDLLYAKFVACSNLALYALSMKEDFYPWISQAASIFVPLLKFYTHNNIRNNAARGKKKDKETHDFNMAVEKGTAQGGESYFKQLSGDIILALGDALYSEPETKLCAYILRSLGNCLQICGPLLNEEQVCSIIGDIKHVITECSRRKGELTERAKSKDFDVEAAELLREEREQEDEVFENVGHILVTLIETYKAAFLPFFDELSSNLMPREGKDKTAAKRITCFFIFDKLVEYCGEEALKSDRELLGPDYEHFPKIIPVFTEVLCAGKDLATKETTKRMC
ncbi:hypothetical protein A4A49_16246 [Nicotiana attenuata]|uniref:TOG domain-containing protein n=1 Tax=Nicotiana attenuata TaxID=49451 RepID=A0A1J6IG86_NICAT|nr:hypothetical protein A4A49_16246 [Nicotiana attenuata]